MILFDDQETEGGLPAKASPRYGFLIEPSRELVSRLDAESS